MGVVSKIVGAIVEYTRNIDREVERGFNLNEWGDLMKYLHGLQIQAQLLIDLFQRASSLLGYVPSTYVNAGEILLREGIIDEKDFSFIVRLSGFEILLFTSICLLIYVLLKTFCVAVVIGECFF